jgi:5'-deoxynucleotidase YfbR-like HD superfamily hydrolase
MSWAYTWVLSARRGAGVRRFHTVPLVGDETVGKHSHGVGILCCALSDYQPSAALLKAALFHDLAEQETGDIPATTKWANPEIKTLLDEVEQRHNESMGLNVVLSEKEQLTLKWADMLDLLYFVVEQRELGNKAVRPIFGRGAAYLAALTPHHVGGLILAGLLEKWDEIDS